MSSAIKVRTRLACYEPSMQSILTCLGLGEIIVAGGALRAVFTNTPIKDIDLYLTEDALTRISYLKKTLEKEGYEKVSETSSALTYKKGQKVIQVILCIAFDKSNIEGLLDHFDFTITKACYSPESGCYYTEGYFKDLASKVLTVRTSSRLEYPIATLVRSLKYQKYGYTLTPFLMVKLALEIHALEIKTYEDLKYQLQGIDTTIFESFFKERDETITFVLNDFLSELSVDFKHLLD